MRLISLFPEDDFLYSLVLLSIYLGWLLVSQIFPPTLHCAFLYFVVLMAISIPLSIFLSNLVADFYMNELETNSIVPALVGTAVPFLIAWILALIPLFVSVLLTWLFVEKFKRANLHFAWPPTSAIRSLPSKVKPLLQATVKPLLQAESSLVFHL